MRLREAFILSVGLVLAAAIFGLFHYESRLQDETISVVGAATKRGQSDLVKWRITLSRIVGLTDLKGGYARINDDRRIITEQLISSGIGREDITAQPVSTLTRYDNNGQLIGYELQQGMFVASRAVAKVEALVLSPEVFYDQGIVAQFSLEYYLSSLAEMKKELLAAATRDARKRAEQIAANSGAELNDIASARSGVFQITEPYSTEVSDYGIYSTATREKDITVTVHVSFTLN
jgi:hypothetical protein